MKRLDHVTFLEVSKADGQADLIQHEMVQVALSEVLAAALPDLGDRFAGTGVIRGLQTGWNIGTQPGQATADLHTPRQSLINPTLEELRDQNPTAKTRAAHSLTEDTGEAAAITGCVDLKLSFCSNQVQRRALRWRRRQRQQTGPFQCAMVLGTGVQGAMGGE